MTVDKSLENAYAKILTIIQSGRIGTPQVCVCSVNTDEQGEALAQRMNVELSLITTIFGCAEVDKETRKLLNEPYLHGFISREYQNGCIARCTYTSAPTENNTTFTVYGSDGEIRYDTQTGKFITFIQSPDYEGDEF